MKYQMARGIHQNLEILVILVQILQILSSTQFVTSPLMLGMSRFLSSKQPRPCCAFITHLEQTIQSNEQFLGNIEHWRNLEISYIGQLMELQSKIRDRLEFSLSQADHQFLKLFEIVVKAHKNMINKINQEIFQVCFSTFTNIIEQQKNIMKEEKSHNKNFVTKKDQLTKLREKQQTFKKSLAEELIQEIFSHNSISECTNKLKIVQKVEDLYEKRDEHDFKIQQAKQIYQQTSRKSKQNIRRFDSYQQNFVFETLEVLNKAVNSINALAESLSADTKSYMANREGTSNPDKTLFCNSGLKKFEVEYEQALSVTKKGYLETTLELIKNHSIDEITEYTKDKDTRRKIKGVIDSTQVSPQFTDEITRQVQLVKKMIRTKQVSLMEQFKIIISKTCKFRMNFVFMLQLYRTNSQFEMTEAQIQPIVILINEILKASHEKRDAYVLKHIIILLLTYYINIRINESDHKVYILHFFKKNSCWRDLQLWESMLIESIYTEKKSTIRMLLTTSCVSDKSELAAAEKTLILNQILYIVRNMLLFDFVEKQVKQFVNRFVKLLKQDDKFTKQVYKSIEIAIKEEQENKQPQLSMLQTHEFYKIIQSDFQT